MAERPSDQAQTARHAARPKRALILGPRRAVGGAPKNTPFGRGRKTVGIGALVVATIAAVGLATPLVRAADRNLDLAPGQSDSAALNGGSQLNTNGIATFTVPSLKSGAVYVAVQLRTSAAGTGYRAKARINPDGSFSLSMVRTSNWKETVLSTRQLPGSARAGSKITVQAQVTGTDPVKLLARSWVAGSARPDYQVSLTDSSSNRVRTAGGGQVWSYLSSGSKGSVSTKFGDQYLRSVDASTPTTKPTSNPTSTPKPIQGQGSGRPNASNTGVPAGTSLKQVYGNQTITQAGTVIDGWDIHGFVTVRAANVTIKNSIVRGGTATGNEGLITNYGFSNLLIQRVDLIPSQRSVWVDGIKGWDFTADGVHVTGNVDSVKIHGDNVTVKNSLLENTTWFPVDPNQGGGPTHNDNIQILQGENLLIQNNTIRGATNFAILGGAEQDNVTMRVLGNYLDGGHCTVKLQTRNGRQLQATVGDNTFGPNRAVQSCPFQATPAVSLNAYDNTFEKDGSAVNPLRLDG